MFQIILNIQPSLSDFYLSKKKFKKYQKPSDLSKHKNVHRHCLECCFQFETGVDIV